MAGQGFEFSCDARYGPERREVIQTHTCDDGTIGTERTGHVAQGAEGKFAYFLNDKIDRLLESSHGPKAWPFGIVHKSELDLSLVGKETPGEHRRGRFSATTDDGDVLADPALPVPTGLSAPKRHNPLCVALGEIFAPLVEFAVN